MGLGLVVVVFGLLVVLDVPVCECVSGLGIIVLFGLGSYCCLVGLVWVSLVGVGFMGLCLWGYCGLLLYLVVWVGCVWVVFGLLCFIVVILYLIGGVWFGCLCFMMLCCYCLYAFMVCGCCVVFVG